MFKTIPATFNLMMQADNEVLDEVVVTAGRFEQRMTDVTVSIEVVKPEALRSQAPTDLSATLQTLPGVEVIDKQPSIRGGGGWTYSVGSRCQVLMDGMTILNPKTGEINWNNVPLERFVGAQRCYQCPYAASGFGTGDEDFRLCGCL